MPVVPLAQGTQGMRSTVLCPAHSLSVLLPSLQPLGVAGAWGARWVLSDTLGGCKVRVPPVLRGPAVVFPVFCQPEAACVSGCFRAVPHSAVQAPPPLHPPRGPGAPAAPVLIWHTGGFPGSCRTAVLPLEPGIPVAL